MDCEGYREAVFAALRGVEGEVKEKDLNRHLDECASCRRAAPGLAGEFVALNRALVPDPTEAGWKAIDERVLKAIRSAPADSAFPQGVGGETMLDMGNLPKAAAAPPPPPPNLEATFGTLPAGGETMLDLGHSPLAPSKVAPLPKLAKEGAEPATPPAPPPDRTMEMMPGGGATMLDAGPVGATQPAAPAPGGATPPATKVPGDSTSYDITIRRDSTPGTPATSEAMTGEFEKLEVMHSTPKTTSGGSTAALANAKAIPPEAAQAAKDPNRVFGKYILLSELGRGGVGVVYKAWDSLIMQYVALKFIKNQDDGESGSTDSGSTQIEEFQREARMSVRLRHPNIVRIYELGCMSNRYYLSMEYIEGGTLLAMIHGKERNFKTRFNADPEKFIRIMHNICLAVDYAHNTKPPIIHRDLKPHNVLVDTKGNPFVVDFGLAKEVDSAEGSTLTGVVKGTPTYMAPEQAEGKNRDVDARTDVYALGAILYEILTGRPPFLGESVPEILRKIATELPERPNEVITKTTLSESASSTAKSRTKTKPLLVPKPLETICLKAIEKAKLHRYQTAKELADDIERYLKNEDILAQEPGLFRRIRRQVRQHPVLSAVAGAVMLAVLTAGGVLSAFGGGDGESGRKLIERIVERGENALKSSDWIALRAEADNLAQQDRAHPMVNRFEKALREHRDLVEKTQKEWRADLDRIRREPLAGLIPGLREKFRLCPDIHPELSESLRVELVALQRRTLEEARGLVGSGARPAWVEEIIKTSAKAAREQCGSLIGLAGDAEFPYATDAEVSEAFEALGRIIAYQGTWTLQVNVAPYAEVSLSRSDKELASDFTPLGLQELEVVGSSYVVELCWPSRQDPKVKVLQEVKDIAHGQTIVIRGDISREKVIQERR